MKKHGKTKVILHALSTSVLDTGERPEASRTVYLCALEAGGIDFDQVLMWLREIRSGLVGYRFKGCVLVPKTNVTVTQCCAVLWQYHN
jgi:hypothetical protein